MTDLSLFYGWSSLDNDCNMLATMAQMNLNDGHDHVIMAINNDLIPATLIANRLGASVVQVKYGDFLGIRFGDNKLPMITTPLISGSGEIPNFPKLTIVVSYFNDDEIIKKIVKYYESVGHYISILALYHTPNHNTPNSLSERTKYQNFVPQGAKLTFPWKL